LIDKEKFIEDQKVVGIVCSEKEYDLNKDLKKLWEGERTKKSGR